MTRCDAYWLKVRQFLDNGDRAALEEFCDRNPRTIRTIIDHAEYCSRNFDNSSGGTIVPLSELAARPLRQLERADPVLHAEVLAEVLKLEEPTAPVIAKLVAQRVQHPAFVPKLYDIWSFNQRDPRYGQADYKWGLICGQIIENLLYYYTETGDTVLDPMAGGGTTNDVCLVFNRRCEAFDIEPARDDIRQHDLTTGPPPVKHPARLAVLEPPYYNMKQDAYDSLDEYLEFLRLVVHNTAKCVQDGGHLALILMDQVTKGRATDEGLSTKSMIGEAYTILRDSGLKYDRLVALPLTTEQYNEQQVVWGKKAKILLGINRQMWVFRRPEE